MIKFLTRPSLFRRLLLVELAAAAAFWFLYAGVTMYSVYEQGEGFLDQDLQLIAQSMARLASTHSDEAGMRRAVDAIQALNVEASVPPIGQHEFAYQIWRGDGTLLFRSTDSPHLPLVAPDGIANRQRYVRGEWIVHGQHSPDRSIFAVAGYSRSALARLRAQLIQDASLGYLWIVGALTIILWIAAMVGLRPLRSLAAQLSSRTSDDLTPLHPAVSYSELSALMAALNEKIGHIRALLDRERAFFADAAHELRTPLAALEAQSHLLVAESTPAGRQVAQRAFEQGIERTAGILNKLLSLARLDASHAVLTLRSTDLVPLLQRQVAQHAPRIIAAGSRIELRSPPRAEFNCDGLAIETALDHLIDNAALHTPSGTTIEVELRVDSSALILAVSDDGPGIPVHERDRVFERFVRLDSAVASGSGLGLAIVRRIAQMHGGDVVLLSREPNPGCRFEFRIPEWRTS